MDQDARFLDSLKEEIEMHSLVIKNEKLSIKVEKEAVVKVEKADSNKEEAKLGIVEMVVDGSLVKGANI